VLLGVAEEEIIVVGARLSGLTTAPDPVTESVDVIVTQARDRTGGRKYTDHSRCVPLELGASWILVAMSSANPGTSEGAMESGARAAREILALR